MNLKHQIYTCIMRYFILVSKNETNFMKNPSNLRWCIFHKWDKLYNVPFCWSAISSLQDPIVPVQEVHVTEVCIPYPHNDEGHGQTGGIDNGVPGLVHVRDDSISQQEQNIVSLFVKTRKHPLYECVPVILYQHHKQYNNEQETRP